ncbi:MAG: beta-galactosidase [Planctomycetota bacterium]
MHCSSRLPLSIFTCAFLLTLPLAATAAEPEPHPLRGLYSIWAKPEQQSLPFLRGGQLMLQWADVQPAADKYDFSTLDKALAMAAANDRPITVQINGNQHPEFLFRQVPYVSEKLSVQVRDQRGTLQYWHPTYREAYLKFLAAYGQHVKNSPHTKGLLGVRLNFNAVGTEHMTVPKQYIDPASWTQPPGVSPGPKWTREVANEYKEAVIDAFVANLTPEVLVFVRNNAVEELERNPKWQAMLDEGRLGLFHTSSEIEPHSVGTERQYLAFLKYCRPGKTLAYAESWADAWGRHGGGPDPRWCHPAQYNYWRLLVDLNCGVSFIAVYGNDLKHSNEPEFRAAFDFARKYAGYHASPSAAPGAWIALREGDYLKGDYTFLMDRLPGDESKAVKLAGPEDQRYGAWARVVPAGGRMRLKLNETLAARLANEPAVLRVVYLDADRGKLDLQVGKQKFGLTLSGTGRWQLAELPIPPDAAGAEAAMIELRPETDLTLHMIEVDLSGKGAQPKQ